MLRFNPDSRVRPPASLWSFFFFFLNLNGSFDLLYLKVFFLCISFYITLNLCNITSTSFIILFQVTANPSVHCFTRNKRIIIAVNENLFMLANENVSDCCFSPLGCHIDAVSVSPSGELVICALADGNICGIHISGVPLFTLYAHTSFYKFFALFDKFPLFFLSRTIDSKDIKEKTFTEIICINQDYYVMCTSGILYRWFLIEI